MNYGIVHLLVSRKLFFTLYPMVTLFYNLGVNKL
jgi:hypothetical protein